MRHLPMLRIAIFCSGGIALATLGILGPEVKIIDTNTRRANTLALEKSESGLICPLETADNKAPLFVTCGGFLE